MGLRYVWLAVALIVLFGAASVFTLFTGKPAGNSNSFRLSVGVDQSQYRPGEMVTVSGKACSESFWWFKEGVGGGGGVHVTWRVLDESGQTVADNSHQVMTAEMRLQIWWPRGCRSWEDEWDLHYWNRPDQPLSYVGPARGDRLPPGTYRIEVKWHVSRWVERPLPGDSGASATHTHLSDPFEVGLTESE